MTRARTIAIAALAASALGVPPSLAASVDTTATLYTLITPPSAFEVGCFGPCACPIVERPTYGSFQLVQTGVDPLYTYYAVQRYVASFNNGPGAIAIVGSGQLRIGGEFALVEELTLDLSIEGQPPVHFDSGLKPVTAAFPRIDLECAVHGFACFDSVVVVEAMPADPASVPPPVVARPGLRAVRPNPFVSSASIAFALERSAPVSLAIVDAGGRRVRALAAGRLVPAGPQSVSWDGRYDDGRLAPPGVYWVSLRWPGGADSRRLVKLD